jgi:hypothetical protein
MFRDHVLLLFPVFLLATHFLPLHQALLVSRSDYFRGMFLSGMREVGSLLPLYPLTFFFVFSLQLSLFVVWCVFLWFSALLTSGSSRLRVSVYSPARSFSPFTQADQAVIDLEPGTTSASFTLVLQFLYTVSRATRFSCIVALLSSKFAYISVFFCLWSCSLSAWFLSPCALSSLSWPLMHQTS